MAVAALRASDFTEERNTHAAASRATRPGPLRARASHGLQGLRGRCERGQPGGRAAQHGQGRRAIAVKPKGAAHFDAGGSRGGGPQLLRNVVAVHLRVLAHAGARPRRSATLRAGRARRCRRPVKLGRAYAAAEPVQTASGTIWLRGHLDAPLPRAGRRRFRLASRLRTERRGGAAHHPGCHTP